MSIIVTGGCGFIGSNLIRELRKNGEKIICIDNLDTGKLENISDIIDENLIFENLDIIHMDCTKFSNIKGIYHLACNASPPKFIKEPIQTIQTCVQGTLNCLEIAKRNNCPILFTSTSEVYGEPEQHPQTESYRGNVNFNGIRACYDEGKRIAETLMFSYKRMHGMNIKIVRIFNTYGPYMKKDDGRVISNFINQALKNNDITVNGNGKQTRSLCYVSDTVRGLIKMMNNNSSGPVNIGNPDERTILEVANIIKIMCNSSSKIVYREMPKDDPTRRKPDISLAGNILDWKPVVSFKDGIEKTIQYYSNVDWNDSELRHAMEYGVKTIPWRTRSQNDQNLE